MIVYSALYRSIDADGRPVVNPLGMAKRLAVMAPTLARYGCNAVLWPPLTMSQGGAADNADGYGKARDLDVGQFHQPTRWGFAADVLVANTVFHRHGMMALEDAVVHQYEGALPIYELGAEGTVDTTLFPKPASSFVPQAKVDSVFDPDGNAAFGQEVSYENGTPAGYMLHGTIQAMQWRKRVFGLDGGRLDDTKGEAAYVSQRMIEAVGGWWFGECFTGNPTELEQWVTSTGGKRTLDFTLHFAIKAACEGSNSLRALPGNGLYAWDPAHAVLFVDNADTDLNNGENVRFNKIWGYLLILTLPAAAAMVYAGDYEKYDLADEIDNLMWFGTMFAFGNLRWEHVEDDVIVWSRDGDGGSVGWSGGLLCGFNRAGGIFSTWVRTPFGRAVHLHDYCGNAADLWTNADGWVNLIIPACGYVTYAPAGVNRGIPITALPEHATGQFTNFSDITVTL